MREARRLDLLSDEHFSVDGTLIEAWASMKSYREKDGGGSGPDAGGDRDFRGERRTNDTHASTTDPEAKLRRKGPGKESKLCFAGHALMDNRHGLITDVALTPSVGVTEPEAALDMLQRQRRKHLHPKSVGADKGYLTRLFVSALLSRGTAAHVAYFEARNVDLGVGVRESRDYAISQIARKRIEQFWGWGESVGGLRKTRLRGARRNAHLIAVTGAAYNLLRISRLCPTTG